MQNCIAINIYRVFSYKILYQNAPCKSIARRVNILFIFLLLIKQLGGYAIRSTLRMYYKR